MTAPRRRLLDSRVLITGAGSGLGRACALAFAARGWRVACSDRDAAAAEQTLGLLRAAGGTGLALAVDVCSEASFSAAVDRLQREWNGLDVLINNAGIATAGTVADAPLAQWQQVLDINLLGCVRGARAVIPLLQAQRGGHIVNVASFAGIANPPAMASYNAAKAAVISLSETLRYELFPSQVGVSVACPSFFKTRLLETSRALAADPALDAAPQMNRIVERLMAKATVSAEDVAADILDAVLNNRFMVMTHPDARSRARLKRVSPELYFRLAQKMTEAFLRRP
ncbi:MAG TPA: SDR family NAD(P)-dependent oxidoreductase [Nevskiaceae bacterium]|nr:SDR family NAD(P)-dependent oxidoreductase [Nevskiaceae bacterium]